MKNKWRSKGLAMGEYYLANQERKRVCLSSSQELKKKGAKKVVAEFRIGKQDQTGSLIWKNV